MLCGCECCRWGKARALSSLGLQEATTFLSTRGVPRNWKMDISEILESSSSDEEDGAAAETDEEEPKREEKTEEVAVSLLNFSHSWTILSHFSGIIEGLACLKILHFPTYYSQTQLTSVSFQSCSFSRCSSCLCGGLWAVASCLLLPVEETGDKSQKLNSRQRRVKGFWVKRKGKT